MKSQQEVKSEEELVATEGILKVFLHPPPPPERESLLGSRIDYTRTYSFVNAKNGIVKIIFLSEVPWG